MKTRTTWLSVAASLALVLAVMAWVTATLLSLDAARTRAEREGVVEEQTRLALWRVDSAMTPILAREVALLDAPPQAELDAPPAGVVMRFDLDEAGLRALTQATPERREQLEAMLSLDAILAELGPLTDPREGVGPGPGVGRERSQGAAGPDDAEPTPYALKTQSLRNEDEWSRRRATAEDNLVAYGNLAREGLLGNSGGGSEPESGRGLGTLGGVSGRDPDDPVTLVRALWIGDELLLVRGAGAGARRRVQGSWLDWSVLRALLHEEIADLLPHAELVAVAVSDDAPLDRMLATLPAKLVPGATIAPPPAWSPLRASLVAAWLIVLCAMVLVFGLVRASTLLSDRRATFVSAVTHELRTPLTTFRMYTQMLDEGMVEHKRARYVEVLRREADRLSALVENVLSYAQIESERGHDKLEPSSAGALVDRVIDRLRERCEAANIELELALDGDARDIAVLVDPAAVEQILFNLVDNASKYACAGDEARLRVWVEPTPRALAIHVRDFGPGVAAGDARRIFEPFTKARADAAGTKPGVGLGLALSRRLARQMRGELRLRAADPGADFVLTLPRA